MANTVHGRSLRAASQFVNYSTKNKVMNLYSPLWNACNIEKLLCYPQIIEGLEIK